MSVSVPWIATSDLRLFATTLIAATVGFCAWLLGTPWLGWSAGSTAWLILVFAIVAFATIQFAAGYRSTR